jgi:hypothetical protein
LTRVRVFRQRDGDFAANTLWQLAPLSDLAGNHDHRNADARGAQGTDEADAIEARHVPIGQDKIESIHGEEYERFLTVGAPIVR